MNNDIFTSSREHAFDFKRADSRVLGILMGNSHSAEGLDVFFSSDDVSQEACRGRPAISISCGMEYNANAAFGDEFRALTPELLRRKGRLS